MIPRYGEWQERYASRGLTVVGVHSPETDPERDLKSLRAFVTGHGIHWAVVLDPYLEAWRRFGVEAWPTVFVIDRTGVVRAAFVGDDRAPEIEAEVQRWLSAKAR